MSPVEELVRTFQDLVAQVPAILQPFIVLLAGGIPFIEGEGASPIGVIGGINPVVAGIAAALGNFLVVTAIVLLGSRARTAVAARRARRTDVVAEPKPESKARRRFRSWLVRFGVPGASLLGPLAIPTHFTSAMLVASGTSRGWILLWQGVAIALWTTLTTTAVWIAVQSLVA